MTEVKKNNRNPIKQWFITFPQSDIVGREEFVKSLPPYDSVVCGQEEHKDEGLHLHCYIELKKKISQKKLKDWIDIKWPDACKRIHYKPVKNVEASIDYIRKEDPRTFEVLKKNKFWGTKKGQELIDGWLACTCPNESTMLTEQLKKLKNEGNIPDWKWDQWMIKKNDDIKDE